MTELCPCLVNSRFPLIGIRAPTHGQSEFLRPTGHRSSGAGPVFFETDIALFVGDSGRTALRFESEYELLLTQRLILTPDIEVNFYGQDDVDIGIGSGLSDLELGLRLRYEIRREFAPYIGVNWSKLFGKTKDFATIAGDSASEAQLVIGLRAWF